VARKRPETRGRHVVRAGGHARPAVPEPPPADAPASARAAIVLWIVLAVLAVARIALAFDSTMWAWSLNLLRFVPPPLAIALGLAGTVALAPPIARSLAPTATRLGDGIARHPVPAALASAAVAAALVWTFPDRTRFVGDFLLRQGTIEEGGRPGVLFPQALPLDVALHYTLPAWLGAAGLADAERATRLMGALNAGLLGTLAVAFARAMAVRGAAALIAVAAIVCGGYLAMFTGYSKATCELAVLTAAVGVFGLRAARRGEGLLALGLAVALALALHRAALAFLPALVVAWALAARAPGKHVRWTSPATIGAAALPLAALAWMGPRIVATVSQLDAAVHLRPAEVRQAGGVLAAMFTHGRLGDLVNDAVLLSPAALAIPFVLAAFGRALPRGRELLLLGALAVPLVAFMPLLHPAQGLHRDWDNFAMTGVALSMLVAWLAAEALRGAPRLAGLALAATLALATHAMAWLAIHSDVDRGLARVTAFVREAPQRSPSSRATTYDYLGIRNFRLGRWEASAGAFARAAETAPSPRILQQWAMAETSAGRLAAAQDVYRRLLGSAPADELALFGMAAVSSRLSQVDTARVYIWRLLAAHPDHGEALSLLRYLETEHPARPRSGEP
jgi:tetratricopeptide (TPR) repeat protein